MRKLQNSWRWLALFALATVEAVVLGQDIDVTKDEPATLLGTSADNYSIHGLRLGMRRREAQEVLGRNPAFLSDEERFDKSKIVVFKKDAGGGKGNSVMTLVWDKKEDSLSKIVLYPDVADSLAPKFRLLFTEESVDQKSSFKKEFIGNSTRSAVTLDVPSLKLRHMTYFHDDIGLELTRQTAPGADMMMVGLVRPKGKAKPRSASVAKTREWSDSTGRFKVMAELVKSDGASVTLRKEDKKEIVVQISRLSDADRKYLESQSK